MRQREAVRILMLSPFYFRLEPSERSRLVKEFCESFNKPALALNKGKKETLLEVQE